MFTIKGNKEIVEMLLNANADVNIKINDGRTALIACRYFFMF